MKTGLIMEGGAMRGMFTAGVTDVMMENHVEFNGAIGVSAGAVFGCNYKSNQPGRTIRYNVKYCNDPRYAGFRTLIKTGSIYGEQFCYDEIPNKLDLFDVETYQSSPMEFYATCTDIETGEPVYHKCDKGTGKDMLWLRASASMPLVSPIVEVEGYSLLDGGMADSVPLRYFESIGYDRNVVILTQPISYQKKKNKLLPMIKKKYKKYPKLVEVVANRHEVYNANIEYIKEREKSGEVFVVRPSEPLNIGPVEHHAEKLMQVYNKGRKAGEKALKDMKEFLETK